jgi:hypothetical protein
VPGGDVAGLLRALNRVAVQIFFAPGLARHSGIYAALVMGVAIVLSKWLYLYFLYRQKIFLKA